MPRALLSQKVASNEWLWSAAGATGGDPFESRESPGGEVHTELASEDIWEEGPAARHAGGMPGGSGDGAGRRLEAAHVPGGGPWTLDCEEGPLEARIRTFLREELIKPSPVSLLPSPAPMLEARSHPAPTNQGPAGLCR